MRPERAQAFPLPARVTSPAETLRAANDNEPCIQDASAGFIVGRALIVLTALATAGLVVSGIGLAGRGIWRSFF
ncbi:hypothetical protein [Bosea thiooxidans]